MSDDFLFDSEDLNFEPDEGRKPAQDLRDLAAAGGMSIPGLGEEEVPLPVEQAPPKTQGTTEIMFPSFTPPSSPSGALPILGAVGAGVAGGMYAGAWGAAAGVAASGAAINLIRYATTRNQDPQAANAHVVFAVVSALVAAYTGHKAYTDRKERTTRTRPMRSNNREMPSWLKKRTF